MKTVLLASLIAIGFCLPATAAARDPDQTIGAASAVLDEFVDMRVRGIPAGLLAESHGVAIVPGVIKVGLVVGGQRGKGVVIVREADGSWRAPMFITLTGGSVGWQAGAQSTDVVLVFKTQRSVENLLDGKFTIGADAAAAAGPVGRRAAAATDAQLQAEIYSYSRTRGLFAGVSLDGSVLEVDDRLNAEYYGAAGEGGAAPEAAIKLVQRIAQFAANPSADVGQPQPGTIVAEPLPTPAGPTPAGPTLRPAGPFPTEPPATRPSLEPQPVADANELRQELARSAEALKPLVDRDWQKYLQLPDEVAERGKHPSVRSLAAAAGRYDTVAGDARYRALAERPEFQATRELLRAYLETLNAGSNSPRLALPPPP
jgi:lipid-binding SYLF domain-containing protein